MCTTEWTSRFLWHEHFQRVFVVAGENLPLEYLKMLSINVVLMFSPCGTPLLVLKSPVDREQWRKNLKLEARNEHFVDLCVSCVTIADEPFVMLWIVVWRNEERFVEKLSFMDYNENFYVVQAKLTSKFVTEWLIFTSSVSVRSACHLGLKVKRKWFAAEQDSDNDLPREVGCILVVDKNFVVKRPC